MTNSGSIIGHFGKYCLFVPPKFCISIVFVFSWDHCKSQEKLETMLMLNFGGTNKKYYGIFRSGLLWSAAFRFTSDANRFILLVLISALRDFSQL